MKKVLTILVAVVLLAGLLTNTGCKKNANSDIRGDWTFIITLQGDDYEYVYEFSGGSTSGDVSWEGYEVGTYSVSGDVVSITMEYYDSDDNYTVEYYLGYFDSDDQMSGSMSLSIEGYETVYGTWIAVR